MAEELITDLIDEPRISKQLSGMIGGLTEVKEKILEINNLGKGIRLGDDGAEFFKRAKTAAEQLAAAEAKLLQANTDLGKELAKVRVQTQEINKANKDAARESLGLVDAYKKLSNQYADAARAAKNLAAIDVAKGLKEFSKATKDAMASANNLHTQLKAIDAGVGDYRRNVGNYASATAALNQILREAPSLAINFQTFALAISNNLPILFDEFNKLSKAIDQNTGKVNGATNALKQLAASLFSPMNLLTVGITLFTLFSKQIGDFVSKMFESRRATDAMTAAQEALNKEIREGVKGTQDEIAETKRLFTVAQDITKSTDERKEAIRQLRLLHPGYLQDMSDEKILAGDTTGVYNQLVVSLQNMARTKAILGRISKNSAKDLDLEADLSKAQLALDAFRAQKTKELGEEFVRYSREKGIYLKGEYELVQRVKEIEEQRALIFTENEMLERRASKDTSDLQKSLLDKKVKDDAKSAKDSAKNAIDSAKARIEAERSVLEAEAISQRAIFENEKKSFDERANALAAFTLLQNGIARKGYELGELEAKGNADKIKASKAEFNKAYTANEVDHYKELLEITKDYLDEESAILINANKVRQDQLGQQEAAERAKALEFFRSGHIDTEQYESERLRIENKYNILRLQSEADTVRKILELRKMKGEDIKKVSEDLLDIENKIRELDIKYQESAELAKVKAAEKRAKEQERISKDTARKQKKDYEDLSRQVQQVFRQIGEIGGPILDIISNRFAAQSDAINEQIKLIDKREREEIEAVNRSTASQQEKDDKIAVIEANAESRRRALEAERRRVAQQQARFDKAKAIFDIVANTAVNVVKFLGVPVLAALAAAVGAAQLAAVASRPIPQYRHGRKGGPAEFAYVGDGGVSEVVEHNGRMWVTPRRATLTYLPAGATVHKSVPDFMDHKGIAAPTITAIPDGAGGAIAVSEIRRGNRRIVEAIRNNKVKASFSIGREGVRAMISDARNHELRTSKFSR